ncbi:MAG TPA: dihydrolipoyl dehydrogenase [Candidatus Scatomorpha merdavium]|nr:dihydrolipoyl dehydrogenase [Candidatus Scatomorpha merdavium]
MAKEVVMPKLGLTMTEGTVEAWLKNEGDEVKEGEKLFSVSTDKLTNDIEATVSGKLLKILVPAGETVACLTPVAVIGAEGESYAAAPAKTAAPAKAEEKSAEGGGVLVIGGGPGGYVAAIRAAQLGAKVTLAERAEIGGTCLNRGCMPTKALLHSSEVYELATNSVDIGIIGRDVAVDWPRVQATRQSVSDKLTGGVRALMRANKVTVVEGEAKFTGPKTVKVGDKTLNPDKIIIAVGSKPVMPPIPGLKECPACIDSTACLKLDHIPESLVVIGGGVIGVELGSVYRRFGSKVSVLELQDRILPQMDGELAELAAAQLVAEGMDLRTGAKVTRVDTTTNGAAVHAEIGGKDTVFEAEKVLVCVGRSPNLEGLGLDKAGIAVEGGFIKVDKRLETSVPGVFAVGDCSGRLMLAHAAMAMGEAAAENAMGGEAGFNEDMSPACAYVGPEIAGVGYTEERAKELGIEYIVGRFPTSANGRSLVSGCTGGIIKVLAGPKFGEILGVHILAPSATELIEEAALAIRLEATLDELTDTIHCHPTVAEALREAALAAQKRAIHIPNKK